MSKTGILGIIFTVITAIGGIGSIVVDEKKNKDK